LLKFKKLKQQHLPEKVVEHFESVYTAAVVLYEKALLSPTDPLSKEIIKHFELGEYAAVVAIEALWY